MKIIAIAAAAALVPAVAAAQMSPTPQTTNITASAERQIELQEPTEANLPSLRLGGLLPDIDFTTTASVDADADADFRQMGHYSANTRSNLSGR